MPLAGNSLRAEKSQWQVQKVTLAGPKSHTRAKMSHWSVIISDNSPVGVLVFLGFATSYQCFSMLNASECEIWCKDQGVLTRADIWSPRIAHGIKELLAQTILSQLNNRQETENGPRSYWTVQVTLLPYSSSLMRETINAYDLQHNKTLTIPYVCTARILTERIAPRVRQ